MGGFQKIQVLNARLHTLMEELKRSRSENEMLKRKDAAPVQRKQLSALLSARDSEVAYLRKQLRESLSHMEAGDDALTCIQELEDQA
jgi:lipid A disaccharide synthetase